MSKMYQKKYGDLLLNEQGIFAIRGEYKIHFTRNERAILLALTRNPNMLMTRSRLLDELAADEDRSDRYIDFLVNRLRSKLRDDPKSPTFIQTRYGEGYVWALAPTATAPLDALLVIAARSRPCGHAMDRNVSALVERLHETIDASIGSGKAMVVGQDWHPSAEDKVGHLLQLNVQQDDETLCGVGTLREMPSRRIIASFPLNLHSGPPPNLSAETKRISRIVLAGLQRGLGNASAGLGLTPGAPPDSLRQEASIVLLGANPRWAGGTELARERVQDPHNADLAFQWCYHLFFRLTVASPFEAVDPAERRRMEREIELTTLEHLPAAEDNPLLMFAAAKLLYYLDRGHLELAEDLAERALARTGDAAATFALMGQLRCARGRFDEAVQFFDRGAKQENLGADFQLHIRIMKCVALLAAGRRNALDAALAQIDTTPPCPSHIALMIDWTFSPDERPLSAASAKALAALGRAGAANAIDYAYHTSARQIVSAKGRANVMRGLVAQVTRAHGAQAVPAFVGHILGLNATP